MPTGWIDDVDDGVVYGRIAGTPFDTEFSLPILEVLEDQRVDLEPGMYCSFVNGYLLVNKTIWTTHDIEQAKIRGEHLFSQLRWALPR